MNASRYIGMAVIGIGLVVLLVAGGSGSILGLDSDSFARLIYSTALFTVLAGFVVWRRPLVGTLRTLALWLLIFVALIAGYQYRYELQDILSRVSAGLVPGSPLSVTDASGNVTVTLEKRPDGHFEARVEIQRMPVRMLVDTGATTTVLTRADAARAGLDVASLDYTVPVSTANGMAKAATATVRDITVGAIVRRNVPVLVAADGMLDQSLLGMNFIATLSGFDIRGDRMILRD